MTLSGVPAFIRTQGNASLIVIELDPRLSMKTSDSRIGIEIHANVHVTSVLLMQCATVSNEGRSWSSITRTTTSARSCWQPSRVDLCYCHSRYERSIKGFEMLKLESLQAELTLQMAEIDAICAKYGYAATPTLLLRHPKGSSSSILLGNDSLGDVVWCISQLGNVGKKSDLSPMEAVVKLLNSGD